MGKSGAPDVYMQPAGADDKSKAPGSKEGKDGKIKDPN
mgnify:CR=1 FL=1|jgi:hypothetical protein